VVDNAKTVPQDPADMVKARLLELQSPVEKCPLPEDPLIWWTQMVVVGHHLLMITGFICERADIAQRRVPTPTIIEAFDIKENVRHGLLAGQIRGLMHQLHFQAAKKAFNHRNYLLTS